MQHADTEIVSAVTPIIERWRHEEGPLLPILNGIQRELGYVPREVLPVIADALNLSRAEVYGVVSFYHDYREKPAGRHVLKLCRAEACQSMGAEGLAAHAKKRLGVDFHQTTADGKFTLEPVFCLGNCACSPAAMIDGELYGRVTPERFDELVKEWEGRP